MKFSLIFDGDLRPNGGVPEKWDIRKQIHPQLEELWRVNPSLKFVQRHSKIDTKGYWFIESHHSLDDYSKPSPEPTGDYLDLCEPIVRGGRKFFPLVRDSFALKSSLRISFLRKEEPGKVYQAGDLDNRLKTLFDALAVPKEEQVVSDQTIVDPIYCLLEDDALIANCTIETHRLLSRPQASKYAVILLIEVDVRVIQPRQYNQPFLGD